MPCPVFCRKGHVPASYTAKDIGLDADYFRLLGPADEGVLQICCQNIGEYQDLRDDERQAQADKHLRLKSRLSRVQGFSAQVERGMFSSPK